MQISNLFLLLLGVGCAFADEQCEGIEPPERLDCGFYGINQQECETDRQCCWDDTVENVPYCFRSRRDLADKCLSVKVDKRRECGYFGIDQEECEDRKCCYDSSDYGFDSKYCFLPREEQCDIVEPKERLDCGYFGIDREECRVNRSCCWDDTVHDAPYCFRSKEDAADPCYSIDVKNRADCGWYGIDEKTCVDRHCCYDDKYYGFDSKYCFYPRGSKCYGIDPQERQDCGYIGIQRDECEKEKGCCFDHTVPRVPWCFKGNEEPPVEE